MESIYFGIGTIGEHHEEISPESMAKINEIINICDNLFFSNYYATGGRLKSKEEIQGYIKFRTAEALKNFYGPQYADYIESRINLADYHFVYQTLGERSSIEAYLGLKKLEYFTKMTGVKSPHKIISWLNTLLNRYGNNYDALLKDGIALLKIKEFNDVLQLSGFDETLFTDKHNVKISEFMSRIREFAQIAQNYSDIPEVNESMHKLQQYVNDYYTEAKNFYAQEIAVSGTSPIEFLRNFNGNDIIAKTTSNDHTLIFKEGIVAHYDGDNSIYLSSSSDDETLIHEADHLITGKGFQKSKSKLNRFLENHPFLGSLINNNKLRENEMIDETFVDFCAEKIVAESISSDNHILNNTNPTFVSRYATLNTIMSILYNAYLEDFKKAHMSDDPIETLSQSLGRENVHIITTNINKLFEILTSPNAAKLMASKKHIKPQQELLTVIMGLVQAKKIQSPTQSSEQTYTTPTNYDHM